MTGRTEILTEYKNTLRFYTGYFQGALSGASSEASMNSLPTNAIDIRLYETVHYFSAKRSAQRGFWLILGALFPSLALRRSTHHSYLAE
ncbi:hypothetical protein E4T39_05181 [Aureobasidium subglaciale]|nr:hypothetical protein E4T39_05181 [Aureobasidium subglaciale]